MTDDEIKHVILWNYRGNHNGPMAQIIFDICKLVRDKCQQPESETVAALQKRVSYLEWEVGMRIADAKRASEHTEGINWRERYDRLHKAFVENWQERKQLRKEVRRFRLANFSVEELRTELTRRGVSADGDVYIPIEDGQYGDGVIKGCQLKVSDDGRHVAFAMRSKSQSHRWEGFQAVPGVRLCKRQDVQP